MQQQQNPYNQQSPIPPRSSREQWQRRAMNIHGRAGCAIYPKWLSQYSIMTYVLALAVVTMMYLAHSLPWYYMLSGLVSVLAFSYYGRELAQQTAFNKIRSERNFEKYIFKVAFVPRVIWMILIYVVFMQNYGDAFGFDNADAAYYDQMGEFVASLIEKGNFRFYSELTDFAGSDDISDMGYGVYVGIVYWLTGNSIIVVRLLKCIWSALTVVLLYRLAKRNFDNQTARTAAIFCALWPNFWYYCGVHLKETEMVFLCVLFVEQADQMLRSRQFTAWKVIPILLVAAALFTFRTPLGLVALLALIFSVVMSSSKVVSWRKRVIVGAFAISLIGVTVGTRLQERAMVLMEQVQSGQQGVANNWRTERQDGNAFAKYAGTAVFAPMIFTLPFPSMVRPFEGQEVQQLLNGGNFIKNIISGFTILAMVMSLLSGKWREQLLPLAFMIGYLMVLAFSSFAHSERFHQPAMPFELMFAAYGLSIAVTKPKYKRWFTYWSIIIFMVAITWNWFKMAGRGLS